MFCGLASLLVHGGKVDLTDTSTMKMIAAWSAFWGISLKSKLARQTYAISPVLQPSRHDPFDKQDHSRGWLANAIAMIGQRMDSTLHMVGPQLTNAIPSSKMALHIHEHPSSFTNCTVPTSLKHQGTFANYAVSMSLGWALRRSLDGRHPELYHMCAVMM